MADGVSIPVVGPGVAKISAEEITNLNAVVVAAEQVQRLMLALRTADSTAVDLPGDGTFGLDVDVTRLPAVELAAATLAALENITVTVANPGTGGASEVTLNAILTELGQKLESGGTVALDAATLAALETIAVTGPLTDAQLRAAVVATAPATAGDVAATLTDGRKTVAAPGTAEAIRASLACRWVTVTALKTNTLQVNVGGSGVLATAGGSTGTPLDPGAGMTLPVDNASKVFVDARVAGEGVSFTVAS